MVNHFRNQVVSNFQNLLVDHFQNQVVNHFRNMQMINLNIQYQPEKSPEMPQDEVVTKLESFAVSSGYVSSHFFEHGQGNGPYVNFGFATDDLSALWTEIKTGLYGDGSIGTALEQSTITTCKGSRGWENYLLLHHFDKGEKLDNL